MPRLLLGTCCLLTLLVALPLAGRPEAKPGLPYIAPEGVAGTVVLAGGGGLPDDVRDAFIQLAGGDRGKLVVVPTASGKADDDAASFAEPWGKAGFSKVTVLHTRDRKKADDAEFVKPLTEATAVWFSSGDQTKLAAAYLGTAFEKELAAVLKRGGVIGGGSAGAAIQSRVMIASGNPEPTIATGFDAVPGAIVDQHFTQRKRQPRLLAALKKHRDRFGIGIDENTALVIAGRQMKVLGKNRVSLILPAANGRPDRIEELKAGDVADLTAWRRAARERSLAFPPKELPACEVPSGSLLIVGGGGMPADVTKKFIDLAGGPEALIVVLPLASGDGLPRPNQASFFAKAGAKNIVQLDARSKTDVEDPKNLAILKQAKGLWFSGGRQWRFVDGYENTAALPLFHDVLKRGGVIGGSSAGASIQGDYLCRANPLGNLDIMAEGYERGFAFLPGSAIDQHFAQRKRFADMTSLMKTFPQYLGIGLDEATAIVVRGSVAEVMGRGETHFYDWRGGAPKGDKDHVSLKAGRKYDVKVRKLIGE